MQTQIYKKKRKKLIKPSLLLTDYSCLKREERLEGLFEIRKRIRSAFIFHIGEENSISPYDLFVKVYEISPMGLDIFKRNYWWNVIKKMLSEMRMENELFIINNGHKLYVLQTKEELEKFHSRMDRVIGNLKK